MDDSPIDFCSLEKELHGRIQAEERYWQQNDAKFRAVEQKVASYEEFRQIVMAAHLKPLDKTDKVQDSSGRYVIWNTVAGMKKPTDNTPNNLLKKNTNDSDDWKLPTTIGEFLKTWKYAKQIDRLKLLKKIELPRIQKLFDVDIPVGFLSDVFELYLFTEITKSDIPFVFGLLDVLSKSQRFNLNLKFLSSSEINIGRELFQKLNNDLQNWKEELAEKCTTEETLNEIRKKYEM
ncbi:hypothetical protein R5R35_006366 [Gryllus longicercus]|uniref:Coiled-coil domain-containing protein 103 n=1 Tax=Gryllus longicercus TaxID=2509291 RepID=A0AAN9WMQ2_9ORTH